jgi:thiamine kinase-like enzyme
MPDVQARSLKAPFQSKYTDHCYNADKILSVFVNLLSPDSEEQIRRAATSVCPFLNHDGEIEESAVPPKGDEQLIVKTLTGGLSNELFIVSQMKRGPSSSVLVRIHPDDDTCVADREVENQLVAWLSKQGIGPLYYGRFKNGRVEEFYQNVAPLSSHEMAGHAPQIAREMANFHSLHAPSKILPKPPSHTSSHYENIDNWFASAVAPSDDKPFLQTLKTEWKWLKSQLEIIPSTASPIQAQAFNLIRQVTLTHMDCQSLNILKDASNSIRLIDFEYAGWNPRAADIANTFCEYCDMNNLCARYQEEYPSDQQQNVYLKAYVQHAKPEMAEQLSRDTQWEPFLATLRAEVGRFSVLSHLGWSIWSIVKAKEESGIEFDYMAYSHHRWDGYLFAKNKFFC